VGNIKHNDATRDEQIKQVRAEELEREAYLLIGAIKMIVDGEIAIKDGKAYDRSGNTIRKNPCLAEKIDRLVNP